MSKSIVSPVRRPPLAAFIASAALLFLPGCVTPNVFSAVLTIETNGDYHFVYFGTFYHHDAVRASAANANDPAAAKRLQDARVRRAMEALSAAPSIISLEYVGNGLFNVCFQVRGNIRRTPMPPGPAPGLMGGSFFKLELSGEKEARFSFSPLTATAERFRPMAESLAKEVDGRIEVYSELPIVDCDGSPGASPNAKTGVWTIKGWEKGRKPLTMTFSADF